MKKWPKTRSEDLGFVRKYCLAKTYPASDVRCRYVKAKIMAKSSEIPTGKTDFKEVDGIFLCRYPDENMPTQYQISVMRTSAERQSAGLPSGVQKI